MKKVYLLAILSVVFFGACTPKGGEEDDNGKKEEISFVKDGWETLRWDFNDSEGWIYNHQDDATFPQWKLQDGILSLSTRAGTRDRSKMRTLREDFGEGLYSWRIYIPLIAKGEQVSVAGFIYKDDAHELDFEVGYGTEAARESCGAQAGQMVACMTNQSFPFISNYTPISVGWHEFAISLLVEDGNYTARWIIDGEVKQTEKLMFGPETLFRVMCSVENLLFMGDHIPEYDTTASFDWVTFTGPAASVTEPVVNPGGGEEETPNTKVTRWDFDNIDGWYYFTHNPEQGKQYYSLKDGILSITTKGNTMDRNKLQTNSRSFGQGDYTWRLYVPEIEPRAQVSVGAFIYADDTHELDFEIGYGKSSARQSCGAGDGDLVACLTNQGNPHNSTYVKITPGWHTCTIRLVIENNRYKAIWIIDGEEVKSLQLNFGTSTHFLVACSVENLTFIGDNMPTKDHTAQFDWVSVTEPKQ